MSKVPTVDPVLADAENSTGTLPWRGSGGGIRCGVGGSSGCGRLALLSAVSQRLGHDA
jgi:hypothetical protein